MTTLSCVHGAPPRTGTVQVHCVAVGRLFFLLLVVGGESSSFSSTSSSVWLDSCGGERQDSDFVSNHVNCWQTTCCCCSRSLLFLSLFISIHRISARSSSTSGVRVDLVRRLKEKRRSRLDLSRSLRLRLPLRQFLLPPVNPPGQPPQEEGVRELKGGREGCRLRRVLRGEGGRG